MSRKRMRRLRRSRRVTAFILSMMLFISILSYAGMTLAAELNTVRFNMRITSFQLNQVEPPVDDGSGTGEKAVIDADNAAPPVTGAPAVDAVDHAGDSLPGGTPTKDLPEVRTPVNVTEAEPDPASPPVSGTTPTDSGYTSEGNTVKAADETTGTVEMTTEKGTDVIQNKQEATTPSSLVATDKTGFTAGENGISKGEIQSPTDVAETEELAQTVKDIIDDYNGNVADEDDKAEYDENTKYLVEKTEEKISADQTSKIITSEITGTTVKYLYNADGTVQTDAQGNPLTEQVTVEAGAIQVEVSASATLGNGKVFAQETLEGEPVFPQKNVVLTLDVSNSMGYKADTDGDGDQEVKWAVLCDAVQTFVKDLYGCKMDEDGKLVMSSDALNKSVVLDLVLFSDAYHPANESNAFEYVPGKLNLAEKTEEEALDEIRELLSRFSGVLKTDRIANEYTKEGILLDEVSNVSLLNTTNGSNVEVGYNAALTAVNAIKESNKDKAGFDASDITVVFMTDGVATSYVNENGVVVHATEYDNIFPVDDLIQNESRQQAVAAEQRLLESGVKLVNVVVNGKAKNESVDHNQRKMDTIRDYMDPEAQPMKDQNVKVREESVIIHENLKQDDLESWVDQDKETVTSRDGTIVYTRKTVEVNTVTVKEAGWYDALGSYSAQQPKIKILGREFPDPRYSYHDKVTKDIPVYAWDKKVTTPAIWEEQYLPFGEKGSGTLGNALTDEQTSRVTYSENAGAAAADVAKRIKEELASEKVTPTQTVIKQVAEAALSAYRAKLISVVPSGFDVVVNQDTEMTDGVSFTVCGKDGKGNTIIEWNIENFEGDFQYTYFLLPNNALGEDYKFGSVLTSDSTILYCESDNGGKEYAIVLDRPVAALSPDAGGDELEIELSSIGTGKTVIGNLRDNDSRGETGNHPEQKLVANGTQIVPLDQSSLDGTRVSVRSGMKASYRVKSDLGLYVTPDEGSPKSRTFGVNATINDQIYRITETVGGVAREVGELSIGLNGEISFQKLNDFSLAPDTALEFSFTYDLQYGLHYKTNPAPEDKADVIGAPADAKIMLLGEAAPEPDPEPEPEPEPGPGPGPGPGPAPDPDPDPDPVIPDEEIEPENVPLDGPENQPEAGTEPADLETISGEPTPLTAGSEFSWALLNLTLTLATALTAGWSLVGYVIGKRKGLQQRGGLRLLSLVPAAGAILAFLLTQNLGDAMVLTDQWTVLMAAIAAVQAGLTVLSIKGEKAAPEEV